MLLDRGGDVADVAAQPGGGDAVPQGAAGGLAEGQGLRRDLADGDGERGVAVPALDDGAAVDGEQVALGEHPVAGHAVHDLLVHRQAGDALEPADALVGAVVQERRGGAGGADDLGGDGVELAGADAGPDGRPGGGEGGGHDEAGPPHQQQLLAGLDLHAPVAEHHGVSPRC